MLDFVIVRSRIPLPPRDHIDILLCCVLSLTDQSGQRSSGRQPLDADTIWDQSSLSLVLLVVLTSKLGESPVVGDVDLLTSWEFELCSSESFDGVLLLVVLASDGDQDLSDVDSCDLTVGLTERTSHTSLEPIGTST